MNMHPAFFADPIVLSPAEALAAPDKDFTDNIRNHYADELDMLNVRQFHVERTLEWFIAELNDGQFWTVAQFDELLPDLESAKQWLWDNGGEGEYMGALERRAQWEAAENYLAAGFAQHGSDRQLRWMKHLGNRVWAVLSDEAGRAPRRGSDLLVLLVHRDEREREITLMEQHGAFGDLKDVLGRFMKVRESTAAVVLKDDTHGDFVAWFNDGSVATGVADFNKDVPMFIDVKGSEAEKVAVLREDYFA